MKWTLETAVKQISRYNTIAAEKIIIVERGSLRTCGAIDYLVKNHGYTQA